MEHEATPAIARYFGDADREIEVINTPYDRVSFTRGLGDSGYRVQTVKHDCPFDMCSFDRMIRQWRVFPESPGTVRYWCLSPNCPYYHKGEFDYACEGQKVNLSAVINGFDEAES